MLSALGTSSLNIELVDSEKTYFPGDAVRGNVVLKMARNTPTKCIILQFIGEITTSLMSLTERKFNETETVVLFNTELILFGGRNTENTPVLTIGEHKFPFEFLLPTTSSTFTLPTSYLGNKGSIQYSLRVVHHKPWVPMTLSARFVRPVLVSDLIDTQEAVYLTPFDQIKEATISLGTFRKSKGIAEGKVFIPKRAFAKGEIIPIKITIVHIQPIKDATGVHVRLNQISRFKANGYEQKQVTAVFAQDLPLNIDATLSCHVETKIRVPRSLPPTTTAPLISFAYELHVKVNLAPSTFSRKRLEFIFPLVIGTYPIIGLTPDDNETISDIDPNSTPTEEEGDWTVVLPHLAQSQPTYDLASEPSHSFEPSSPAESGDPRRSNRSGSLDNMINCSNHSRSSSFQSVYSRNPEPSAPHIGLIENPSLQDHEVSAGPSTSIAQDACPSAPSAFDLGYLVDRTEESQVSSSQPVRDELPPSYQDAVRDGASQHWN